MNREYSLNTTVSLVLPVTTKVRLLEECQRRTIDRHQNISLSDLIREGIEKLLRDAEAKEEEN